MNVLAFDTCLGAVSAAAGRRGSAGWQLHETCEERSTGHAERLLPMVAEVMEAAGMDFADLDRIAVTLGPGGFTSVRVGISAARALALATGKPIVAATSLAVMAHRAEEMLEGPLGPRQLAVAVEAGRGAYYVQTFAAGTAETGEALLLTELDAVHHIGRQAATIVVGTGAPAVATAAKRAGGEAEPRFPDLQPHARNLALMAKRLPLLATVRPLYLRAPDAKPQDTAPLARTPPGTAS